LFGQFGAAIAELKGNPNNGLGDILDKLTAASHPQLEDILSLIDDIHREQPALAMFSTSNEGDVNSLRQNQVVIVDASMARVIADGGKMWTGERDLSGKKVLKDSLMIVPDSTWANVYATMVEDLREHGPFDRTTMGSVANLGLMAMEADEYGSHDKTIVASEAGRVVATDSDGKAMLESTLPAIHASVSAVTRTWPTRRNGAP
jgi:isocitrate dehydrogenase